MRLLLSFLFKSRICRLFDALCVLFKAVTDAVFETEQKAVPEVVPEAGPEAVVEVVVEAVVEAVVAVTEAVAEFFTQITHRLSL